MDGQRARVLLNPSATFPLALRLRRRGITLGEAFTFASGLYFRGKLTYSQAFAKTGGVRIRVITTNAGLVAPSRRVTTADLAAFGAVDIQADDPRYHGPLRRHAQALARRLAQGGQVILLGSIATAKYRELLLEVFGPRLVFPPDFVGRGDMSRGALMLHAARAGKELPYAPVEGAVVNGKRAERFHHTLRRLHQQ